jgi:hypothetical protein
VLCFSAKFVKAVERGGRNGARGDDLLVTARQSVSHRVHLAWVELHAEIVTKQLAYPRVLWYGGEALIEEELEGVVVRAHHERPCPQIWPLVPYCLDKADDVVLVRCELGVLWRHRPAVERDWPVVLMQHGPKS